MVQFNSLLAMSSALPNMTPKDIAAFCGLQESDLVNLAAYTSTIASLSPASLASFGELLLLSRQILYCSQEPFCGGRSRSPHHAGVYLITLSSNRM